MKGRRERGKGRIIGKVDSATFCGPWKSKKSDGDLNRSRVGPSLHGSSIVPSARYTRFTLWDQGRRGEEEGWRWRIFPRRGVKGGSCPWFGGMRATRNSQKPALFSLFLSLSPTPPASYRLFFVSTGYTHRRSIVLVLEKENGDWGRRRMAGHFVNLSPGSRRSARENERKTPRDEGKNYDRSCSHQEVLAPLLSSSRRSSFSCFPFIFFSFLLFSFLFFLFFFAPPSSLWRGRVQSFCTCSAFTSEAFVWYRSLIRSEFG